MANVNTSYEYINLPQVINIGTTATAAVVSGTTLANLFLAPNTNFNARPFGIRACGTVTTAGSYTFVPKLVNGTNSTIGGSGNTIIAAPTAVTIATTTQNWILEAEAIYDATSQALNGSFDSQIGATYVGPASLTSALSGITAATNLNFLIFGLFGTANAANAFTITEFSLFQI